MRLQIAVNGEHFCAFSYRMPLEEITAFEINGTIEDVRTRQLNLFVYPDPSICKPCRTLVLTVEEPLEDFLVRSAIISLKFGIRQEDFNSNDRIIINNSIFMDFENISKQFWV